MRIFRTLVGAAVALAVGFGAAGRGPAVRAQASEQFIFVSVLERGSPVGDLTAEEFIVEEDGQQREVLRVLARPSIPMQVAILVDDSLGLGNLSHIRNGLNDLIDALPDGHQIALITFGDEMRTVVDFTRDKARLKAAATEFVRFSETSSYMLNALVQTALALGRGGATRPIIVLITAEGSNLALTRGGPNPLLGGAFSPQAGQGLEFRSVLNVLRETKVAVHTLVVRGVGNLTFSADPDDSARFGLVRSGIGETDRAAVLEQLPSVTGGGREELGTTSALSELLTRMANEITNQYVVMYARPAGLIPPTEIEVSVTRRRMTVRSTPAPPLSDPRPLVQNQVLFVSAVDAFGEPVTDLGPEELVVLWDGEECETLDLEPINWPVRVTVFVDNGEGGLEALQHMREGLKGFVDAIPEEVEVALLTLAGQPRWVTRHTSDRAELARGIDLIVPDAGAAARFKDALIEEAGRLNDDEERQYFPVIVMVASDGPEGSTSQQGAYDEMLVRMVENSATVHARMFSSGKVSQGQGQQVQVGMNLSDVTRGTYQSLAASTGFVNMLPELARDIARKHRRVSNQYLVTYAPPDGASDQPVIVLGTSREGVDVTPTLDGNVP